MATGGGWTTFPLGDVFSLVLDQLYSRDDHACVVKMHTRKSLASVNLVSRAWHAGLHKHLLFLGPLDFPPRLPATLAGQLGLFTGLTDLRLRVRIAKTPDRHLFYQHMTQALVAHPMLRNLIFDDSRLDAHGFVQLAKLTGLQSLRVIDGTYSSQRENRTALALLSSLTGLTSLELHSGVAQQDLDVLRELPQLQSVVLCVHGDADSSPLSSLRHLTSVELRGASAQTRQHLSLLTSLKRLPSLNIDGDTSVCYLSMLTGLIDLHLQQTSLPLNSGNLNALQHLQSLRRLHLELRWTAHLTPLASLSRLETLAISSEAPHDVRPLAGLMRLASFHYHGGKLLHVSCLGGLAGLTHLHVDCAGIYDLDWLDKLTRLRSLKLYHPLETQIASLAALVNLSSLVLIGADDNTMGCLEDLTCLQSVCVLDGLMTDLAFASPNLWNLTSLVLHNAKDLTDISALQALPILVTLGLNRCSSVDWLGVAGLTKLVVLSMFCTDFADITLLSRLTNLRSTDVRGTPVAEQPHTEIHRLLPRVRLE